MGGASRACAIGDAGPMLNPSGMSLVKTYNARGGVRLREPAARALAARVGRRQHVGVRPRRRPLLHLPPGRAAAAASAGHGHEAGLALSIPFGSRARIGGDGEVLQPAGADAPARPRPAASRSTSARRCGRCPSCLAGVVGTNLRDLAQQPRAAGGRLRRRADADRRAWSSPPTAGPASRPTTTRGRKGTSVMVGGELTLAQQVRRCALGAATTRSPATATLTAGVSAVSEIGAVDARHPPGHLRRHGELAARDDRRRQPPPVRPGAATDAQRSGTS